MPFLQNTDFIRVSKEADCRAQLTARFIFTHTAQFKTSSLYYNIVPLSYGRKCENNDRNHKEDIFVSGWMLGFQNREQWRKCVDTVMNTGVSGEGGDFELLADMLVSIKLYDPISCLFFV